MQCSQTRSNRRGRRHSLGRCFLCRRTSGVFNRGARSRGRAPPRKQLAWAAASPPLIAPAELAEPMSATVARGVLVQAISAADSAERCRRRVDVTNTATALSDFQVGFNLDTASLIAGGKLSRRMRRSSGCGRGRAPLLCVVLGLRWRWLRAHCRRLCRPKTRNRCSPFSQLQLTRHASNHGIYPRDRVTTKNYGPRHAFRANCRARPSHSSARDSVRDDRSVRGRVWHRRSHPVT